MCDRDIRAGLAEVRRRIAAAAGKVGRNPDEIRLIAVSKTLPPAAVQAAYGAGQRAFGENRAQELEAKAPELPADCEWHMIGHLQRNKARFAVGAFELIHSVDGLELARELEGAPGTIPARLLRLARNDPSFFCRQRAPIPVGVLLVRHGAPRVHGNSLWMKTPSSHGSPRRAACFLTTASSLEA